MSKVVVSAGAGWCGVNVQCLNRNCCVERQLDCPRQFALVKGPHKSATSFIQAMWSKKKHSDCLILISELFCRWTANISNIDLKPRFVLLFSDVTVSSISWQHSDRRVPVSLWTHDCVKGIVLLEHNRVVKRSGSYRYYIICPLSYIHHSPRKDWIVERTSLQVRISAPTWC